MNLNVVLVRTETSGNLGATARAAANMGCQRLILIDPQCAIDDDAKRMAAGAQATLQNTIVYPNWDSFYESEGDGLRIAFSRRGGRKRKVFDLEEVLPKAADYKDIYLVFGPEKDGLDSPDLAFVNFCCHLPAFGDFSSYNLSQAVLLALFMFRQKFPPTKMPKQIKGGKNKTAKPLYFPDRLIKEWLEAMGFNVQARRSSAYLTLRRLFLQNLPTQHEIQVLEAVLNQNIRKLKLLGLTAEETSDDIGDISSEE